MGLDKIKHERIGLYKAKATQKDLYKAAKSLSAGDLADFNAMKMGRDPVDILTKALDETTHVVKFGSRVLAVGGHPKGGVWFVTTEVVNELSKAERFSFYRMLKQHLCEVKQSRPIGESFTNFVSVNNHAHVRLLESLGASFQYGHVLSPAGFPFKQFWL